MGPQLTVPFLLAAYRQGIFPMAEPDGTVHWFAPDPRAIFDLDEDFVRAYGELFRHGFAHSVETWDRGRLVGGLYGVAIGGAFMGESMFSRARDASKVALVHLVERLKSRGFALLDTQFMTGHLARFGAIHVSLKEYLGRLDRAAALEVRFGD
jgi:leucyl/phenylalanyl-tRNA--protein transferase